MQTFLFYLILNNKTIKENLEECFTLTAKALDVKRLGKQRLEANFVLNVILQRARIDNKHLNLSYLKTLSQDKWKYKSLSYEKFHKKLRRPGYKNHPVISLWKNYVEELKLYFNIIVKEWVKRGYKNSYDYEKVRYDKLQIPHFLQNETFILYMRRNMMRKLPAHYKKFFGDIKPFNGYYWYTNNTWIFIDNTKTNKNNKGDKSLIQCKIPKVGDKYIFTYSNDKKKKTFEAKVIKITSKMIKFSHKDKIFGVYKKMFKNDASVKVRYKNAKGKLII